MNDNLISELKKARLFSGLKQSDVAEMLGIKNNTLSNWENGRTEPDIDTLVKLCSIYGISCTNLLNETYGISSENLNNPSNTLPDEMELLTDYRNLTPSGQEKVKEYVKDLISNPKYIKVPITDFKTIRQTAESIVAAFDAKNQHIPTKK